MFLGCVLLSRISDWLLLLPSLSLMMPNAFQVECRCVNVCMWVSECGTAVSVWFMPPSTKAKQAFSHLLFSFFFLLNRTKVCTKFILQMEWVCMNAIMPQIHRRGENEKSAFCISFFFKSSFLPLSCLTVRILHRVILVTVLQHQLGECQYLLGIPVRKCIWNALFNCLIDALRRAPESGRWALECVCQCWG